MSFDAETIRTYAVQAVTDFVSNGVPLSQGIAKIASAQELNPEQIKRVVEASNTVAHLKLLSSNQDRTFEFPVAKYETVLGHMVQPDTDPGMTSAEPVSEAYGSTQGKNEFMKYSMDQSQLETYTAKSIIAAKAELEKIAYDKQEILLRMEDAIKSLSSSNNPLEKLAEVADENTFNMLTPYFLMEKTAEVNSKLVFTDKELDTARDLVGLVKEAKELLKTELEKKAVVGAALGTLGRVAGTVIGAPLRAAARKIGGVVGVTGTVSAASMMKKPLNPSTTQSWKRIKSGTNVGMNVGLSTLTEHTNGSVWDQLQR